MDGSLLSFVSRLTTPPAIGVRNNLVLPTRFLALALCNGRSNDASPSDSFAGLPDDAAPDAPDAAAVSPLASPAAAAPTSALAPLLPRARIAKTHDAEEDDEHEDEEDVDAPTVIVAPCRCRPPITDAPPLQRAACALPSADLAPPLLCPRRRPEVKPPVVVTVVTVVVKHPRISFSY